MIIGFYVFIALFIITSVIHLYYCYCENEKLRHMTKPVLLLLLGLAALFYSVENYLIYLSCFLACIGDIFLLKNKKSFYFAIGGTSFLLCHIVNTINMSLRLGPNINTYFYVMISAIIVCCVVGAILLIRRLMDIPHCISSGMYIGLLIINMVISIMSYLYSNNAIYLLVFFGYIMYLVSDLILGYSTFLKDFPRRDFPIMSTYLIAELLVVLGLLFTI